MQNIAITLSPDVAKSAHSFAEFRKSCKNYLAKRGRNFDKFTAVGHDSFIGYVTEHYLQKFIQAQYAGKEVSVCTWEEQYDIARVCRILQLQSDAAGDVNYVTSYFYDSYDILLSNNRVSIAIDIKTAYTQNEPSLNWNFLYPRVQAHKKGKDIMILAYYVVNDLNAVESLRKIVLIGYTSEETIQKCSIVYAGQQTKFGTVSRIDNYETHLSAHYQDVQHLGSLLTG